MATLTSMAMQTLVNQFGQEVTLRKPNYGSYNPSTGTTQGNSYQNYTVKAYMAEYSLSEVNNDSILMGDRKEDGEYWCLRCPNLSGVLGCFRGILVYSTYRFWWW